MKKRIFISFLTLTSLFITSAKAQKSSTQKSSAIIKAGLNLANVSINNNGDIDDAKTLASFQVGIIGDINLAPFFAIQPGLIFTGKGSKTQSGTDGSIGSYRATTNPYYLEVPVNFVLKTPTGQVKFFAGGGPYIAIGIAGKNKTHGVTALGTYNSEKNIRWSNDDPTTLDTEEDTGFGIMRRFDYGLNGLLGIETSNIVLSANFGLGLAKLQSGSNSGNDNNNKHRVLSFTLGFKL